MSNTPVFELFTGLPGSGKSTELRRLAARLEQPDRAHLLTVLVNVEDVLAEQDQQAEALAYLAEAQAISTRLVQRDQLNAVWKEDLEWVTQRIAELQ